MAKPGPKTPQGKDRCRFNAANHFLTSRHMLVLDEQQGDLDALRQCWHEAYPSRNPVEFSAVERSANSEWLLRRKEHQADKTIAKIFAECEDMDEWSDLQRARYDRTERYVVAARREAERDRRLIEHQRREHRAQDQEVRRQHAATQAEELLKLDPKMKVDLFVKNLEGMMKNKYKLENAIVQSVHVSVKNGITETSFLPTNAKILAEWEISTETRKIERAVTFIDGVVPPEYAWMQPRIGKSGAYLRAYVPMTFRTFREVVGLENNSHMQHWPDHEAADQPLLAWKGKPYANVPLQSSPEQK